MRQKQLNFELESQSSSVLLWQWLLLYVVFVAKCDIVHSFGEGAMFRDNRFCKIESINRNREVSAIDNRL